MEHTFLEMVLRLLIYPLLGLTNLPLSSKRDRLREDTLTFNHLQFQDTCMYLLKPVGLVKVFATLQSSCDCTLLRDWSNSKRSFKAHISSHTYGGLFKLIMWLRLKISYLKNFLTTCSFDSKYVTSNVYKVLAFIQ